MTQASEAQSEIHATLAIRGFRTVSVFSLVVKHDDVELGFLLPCGRQFRFDED
jgi:hypothetical protein